MAEAKRSRRPRKADVETDEITTDTADTEDTKMSDTGNKTVKRYDEAITLGEPQMELPPSNRESKTNAIVDAIVEATGETGAYVPLNLGGRKTTSVQSAVQSTAAKRGVKIQTRTSQGQLYARVRPADES